MPIPVSSIRFTAGGELLIWAAGIQTPEQGLELLFTEGDGGSEYSGVPAGEDRAWGPMVFDAHGEVRGRAALTLYENVTYFWRWRDNGAAKPSSSLEHSSNKADWVVYREGGDWRGQFRVMNYLGFAWIELAGNRIRFEIQTRKLDYEREYHRMVEAIAAECQQLLLEWDSPVAMNISSDPEQQSRTLLERFLFLRHVLAPDRIDFYLEMVRRRPHTFLRSEEQWVPAGCAGRTRMVDAPLRYARDWREVRGGAGMAGTGWIPGEAVNERKYETLDTAPNRFLRFALEQFRDTCVEVLQRAAKWPVASAEAKDLLDTLDAFLADPFFADVGVMQRLPIDSQVLQKREGYRDILLAWLLHDAAAKLNWPGRDDVYDGTNRDVATLYEYWLFYRMRSLLKSHPLGMKELPPERCTAGDALPFIEIKDGALEVSLKQGQASLSRFDWEERGRRLRVHLFYNRCFSRVVDPLVRGSYTRPLRPDYSLVLLPTDLAEGRSWAEAERVAERVGRIAYLHFDAKYRVEKLSALFGAEEGDDPDRGAHYGNYKRGDLYKMHTYSDAIRRTSGAYVLYPGSEVSKDGRYEEIIPGVGAFPMRPGGEAGEDEQGRVLSHFIRNVLLHHVNEFSRDYRIRHWTSDTLRETPPVFNSDKLQAVQSHEAPPMDVAVLAGYIRARHRDVCLSRHVFFYHAIDDDGQPLPLDAGLLDAKVLVPYGGSQWLGWWAGIQSRRLVSRAVLAKRLDTEPEAHKASYYYLLELNEPNELSGLPVMPAPRRGGLPLLLRWSELM
jgi:predicted component of viral defense system (DUF524 family)